MQFLLEQKRPLKVEGELGFACSLQQALEAVPPRHRREQLRSCCGAHPCVSETVQAALICI